MWKTWRQEHEDIVLIEDHSHDPLSFWTLSSQADYAFASVRKTFPAPDGALVWSPRRVPLPPEPQIQDWKGSALKLAAMIWKREYLARKIAQPAVKTVFRNFQLEGEKLLSGKQDAGISPWSRALLANGAPKSWRRKRERNVRFFLDHFPRGRDIQPLFEKWPEGHCPLNVILVFKSRTLRERFRSRLGKLHIYTSIHWSLPPDASAHALELSERVLTVPVDQRYDSQDLLKILSLF
jgi:hypothetical protein